MNIQRCDLFKQDGVKVIPVNMIGIMGKGIALVIRNQYPEIYERYKLQCSLDEIRPDNPVLLDDFLLLVTKSEPKYKSDIGMIRTGLETLNERYLDIGISKHVYIPLLGCGCGGLRIEDVTKVIIEVMEKSDLDVTLCLPLKENST